MDNITNKTVASFNTSPNVEIVAQITNYKGRQLIQLRVWVYIKDDPSGIHKVIVPTKKGITLPIKLFPKLKEMILTLEEAVEEAVNEETDTAESH